MCGPSTPEVEEPTPPPAPPPAPLPSAEKVTQNQRTLTTGSNRTGVGKKTLRVNLDVNSPTASGLNIPR